MTDVVFYLKALPSSREKALPWGRDTRLVPLDPASLGIACEGADRLCSSAFSRMHQALRAPDGSVMDNLLARFARGVSVDRVAFVGFSAAHGFLNPLLADDRDRGRTSAVIMMDTCFGSGKTGFQRALVDSSEGRMLTVWVTSHDGSPWERASLVQSGTHCFETQVLEPTGLKPRPASVLEPAVPPASCYRIGTMAWWLRYVEGTKAQIPHWEMGKLQAPTVEAFLLPWLNGSLSGDDWRGPAFLTLAGLLGFAAGLKLARLHR